METHFHMIIKPNVPLVTIMHSLKSYTAHEINKLREKTGGVWLREYYDRVIRSERDYIEKVNYISNNPIKAGFVDYAWLYITKDNPL